MYAPLMRLGLTACLVVFSLTANAGDKPATRVDRMFSAGAAWIRHSGNLLLSVIDQVDPADCSSGARALKTFSASAAQDEKLATALKEASKGATKEENARAQERIQKELGAEMSALTERTNAGKSKLKQFHAACPAEAKTLREAMQNHTRNLEKLR